MNGIFIVAELTGAAREHVHAVQREFDPKLARGTPPHITLAGSSGVGPLPVDSQVEVIRETLAPIVHGTAPLTVKFQRPHRYMTTDIVVLPIDPHGPIRALHEAIAHSGLWFEPSRHAFSPHCTLSFYRRLTPETLKRLEMVRVKERVTIEKLQFYLTLDLVATRKVLVLTLGGEDHPTRSAASGTPTR